MFERLFHAVNHLRDGVTQDWIRVQRGVDHAEQSGELNPNEAKTIRMASQQAFELSITLEQAYTLWEQYNPEATRDDAKD